MLVYTVWVFFLKGIFTENTLQKRNEQTKIIFTINTNSQLFNIQRTFINVVFDFNHFIHCSRF